jgi:hypothetical protein
MFLEHPVGNFEKLSEHGFNLFWSSGKFALSQLFVSPT